MTDDEIRALDAALLGFRVGEDRAVKRVTIDQVDTLAAYYLSARAELATVKAALKAILAHPLGCSEVRDIARSVLPITEGTER